MDGTALLIERENARNAPRYLCCFGDNSSKLAERRSLLDQHVQQQGRVTTRVIERAVPNVTAMPRGATQRITTKSETTETETQCITLCGRKKQS